MFKILQASPTHTGSTVLLNLIHGFLKPDEEIHYDTETLIDKYLITKTHDTDVEKWEQKYPNYKLLFITSERYDDKIKKRIHEKYRAKPNVLVINYEVLLETATNPVGNIIDNVFNLLVHFIPPALNPRKDDHEIKQDMKKRMTILNQTVQQMQAKPFSEWDKFTGIHGNHRNRPL